MKSKCSTRQQMRQNENGLTLIELLIAMTLGLLIVMAATALLLSTKSGYTTQDEEARIQETGRYAIESVSRAVRQSAYENWDAAEAPVVTAASLSANIAGLDASSLKKNAPGIETPVAKSVNGSDVLAIRFFGAGMGDGGDGTMINCAGFGVPAATSQKDAEKERGWSIFYVNEDAGGVPELYCKYKSGKGDDNWSVDAIARGVESFQVLYGLDTDGDARPNRYLTASAINALDDALLLVGANAEEKAIDKNRKTHWKKIVVVKISMLVHGSSSTRTDKLETQYDLFGNDYSDANPTDVGARIKEANLPKAVRNRSRKIFSVTIQLRNQPLGSAA